MKRLHYPLALTLGITMLNQTSLSFAGELPISLRQLIQVSDRQRYISTPALVIKYPLDRSDVPHALDYLKARRNYSSYVVLHAIYRYYPDEYAKMPKADKAEILCHALANLNYLNDWSSLYPTASNDHISANMLLALGVDAVKTLTPLLDNANAAKHAKHSTASSAYQYRRKDFAYRYISLILGAKPVFDADPKRRDEEIENLKQVLKNRQESIGQPLHGRACAVERVRTRRLRQ